jgi:hypothetical protein
MTRRPTLREAIAALREECRKADVIIREGKAWEAAQKIAEGLASGTIQFTAHVAESPQASTRRRRSTSSPVLDNARRALTAIYGHSSRVPKTVNDDELRYKILDWLKTNKVEPARCSKSRARLAAGRD